MNKSPIEGLVRKDIFENTKWCGYCLCQGCGIGDMSPLVAGDQKELCIRGSFSTTDISGENGFCNQMENCLCITEQCAFPPAKGTPPCMICNKKFGADRGEGSTYAALTELKLEDVMSDTFWIYYLFCMGCGVNKMKGPKFAAQGKELCCQGSSNLEGLANEGVYCSQMETTLCIWQECRMPPAPGNPKCAICTWKLNKDHSAAGA